MLVEFDLWVDVECVAMEVIIDTDMLDWVAMGPSVVFVVSSMWCEFVFVTVDVINMVGVLFNASALSNGEVESSSDFLPGVCILSN